MITDETGDVHARYVDELAAKGDWAGLVRYWMAHQHGPALDVAIEQVSMVAGSKGGRWQWFISLFVRAVGTHRNQWHRLARFLSAVRENPMDCERQPDKEMLAAWSGNDRATLDLLVLYPHLVLCEMATQASVEMQERLLQMGLEAGGQAHRLAAHIGDVAVAALVLVLMARGSEELRQLEGARDSFAEALASYRDLARQRPDVYRPNVATTLLGLGNVQRDLNELEAARDSFAEALASFRALARQRPDVYRPNVAMTLNNLGNVQSALNQLESARDSYAEATRLLDEDAATRPTARLVERQHGWSNLGRLYLRESSPLRWPDRLQARNAFRRARACAELFRGRFNDSSHRQRVQGEALHVYELLIQTNVDLGRLEGDPQAFPEAVEVAEASRARNLMEMLTDEALQPASTPAELVESVRNLRRRRLQLDRRLRDEEGQAPQPASRVPLAPMIPGSRQRGPGGVPVFVVPSPVEAAPSPAARVDQLEREFQQVQERYGCCLEQIRGYDPEFQPDAPVSPISIDQAFALLPGDVPTAFVQYTLTRERGLAPGQPLARVCILPSCD